MSHTCSTLVVHCIDFRLQKAIKKYLEGKNLAGTADIVSIAGGVKNLDFIIGQVEISKRLHDIHQVILLNHTDCGAYGGKQAFGSQEEEIKHHSSELQKAKQAIVSKFPDLEIKTLIAKLDDKSSIDFEEV